VGEAGGEALQLAAAGLQGALLGVGQAALQGFQSGGLGPRLGPGQAQALAGPLQIEAGPFQAAAE